jgi:hypothetical protein
MSQLELWDDVIAERLMAVRDPAAGPIVVA